MSGASVFLSPLFPTLGLIAVARRDGRSRRFALERHRADQAGHDKVISQRLMVQTLLSLTEVRDAETGRHSRRTQEYTRLLATQLARHPDFRDYLTPERIDLLASLAPLHDIGKVGVPDRLLNKPGALTRRRNRSRCASIRSHGRDVIVHAERDAGVLDDTILAMAKDIVYTHHEKWDGTGYPQGLRGRAIPIAGRLMALVDVYDAVTTRRAYRDPMSHDDAVASSSRARARTSIRPSSTPSSRCRPRSVVSHASADERRSSSGRPAAAAMQTSKTGRRWQQTPSSTNAFTVSMGIRDVGCGAAEGNHPLPQNPRDVRLLSQRAVPSAERGRAFVRALDKCQ